MISVRWYSEWAERVSLGSHLLVTNIGFFIAFA